MNNGRLTFAILAASGFGAAVFACTASSTTHSSSTDPATSTPGSLQESYVSASVVAPAKALCDLHLEGNDDPRARLRVGVQDDGVARFQARRAVAGSPASRLVMDCVEEDGKASSRIVDLTSDETFASRPYDIARAGGAQRPALAGDPMGYSIEELTAKGYGLRPDPKESPESYGRWLRAASIPVRFARGSGPTDAQRGALPAPRPREHSSTTELAQRPAPTALPDAGVTTVSAGRWNGEVLTGYFGALPSVAGLPSSTGSGAYVFVDGNFTVPTVATGIYGTGGNGATVSIWNGLGGYGYPNALIQGGIDVIVQDFGVSYFVMREFCCGQALSNNYNASTFTPQPGDNVFSEQWYCDANGVMDMTGGYGCSYIVQTDSAGRRAGTALSCTRPNDPTCASVPAMAGWVSGGESAEFIIEQQDPTFPGFVAPLVFKGGARVAFGGGDVINYIATTVSTDPTVYQTVSPSPWGVQLTPSESGNSTQWDTSSAPVMLMVENKCVTAASVAQGTPISIATCTGASNQQWVFNKDATISPASAAGLCLDLASGNTANGASIGLWTCNGGQNQNWFYTSSRTLSGLGSKCLDNPNFVVTDGTPFDYYACNGGVNQKVAIVSKPLKLVAVDSPQDKPKCIEVPNWQVANGTHLDLWDCNGGTNQAWVFGGDGTIRSIVDITKCIDLDGTARGSHVVISTCAGTATQQWTQTSGYAVASVIAGVNGLVIDGPGASTNNGTNLEVWTRNDPNSSNQAFVVTP